MNLNCSIKNLDFKQLEKINIRCISCNFWFENSKSNINSFLGEFYKSGSLLDLFKSKIFELKSSRSKRESIYSFKKNGGIVKAAFNGKKCIGLLLAGKYYLFPKIRLFNIYPPDNNSIFLGCIHIIPEYRNFGMGKKLLMSLEKDLIEAGAESIETIGKRLTDDIDGDEYENSPIIPVKFLIKNGFYIKKNDENFPLLRLDLKSIISEFLSEKLLIKNFVLERGVKTPVVIKKN
jgi:GNAT superfamily N-acetyltransferase